MTEGSRPTKTLNAQRLGVTQLRILVIAHHARRKTILNLENRAKQFISNESRKVNFPATRYIILKFNNTSF